MNRSDFSRRGLLAAAASAPLVAACGGCARGETNAIGFWAMGNEAANLPALIARLERPADAPRLSVQALPWSAAHEKLLTGYAGGSLPDMAQIGNSWLAELVAIGALAPVPVRHVGLFSDQFDSVVETNRINGQLWAVPWYVDTRLHFYRKDLFARAGYAEPPLDWVGWKRALHRVKAVAGQGNYAILLPINEYEHLLTFALSAGATLLDADGAHGAFRAPAFKAALAHYKSMFDEGLAPLASSTQISNVWNEFARGFFSVYPSGPWTIGDLNRRLPPAFAQDWTTTPNPGPTGIGSAAPGGSSLVVFSGAEQADAAWDVIAALLGSSAQQQLQQLTGDLPARRSVWRAAGLMNNSVVAPFAVQLDHARALPKVPEWERIVSEMQVVAERMVRGEYSVDAAAAEMDVRADRLLEKRRWMLERGRAL